MPELAEVEYYRKRWDCGLGVPIEDVRVRPEARIYRGASPHVLARQLTGDRLKQSLRHGKQMLFRTAGGGWLGIHLGMSGELVLASAGEPPGRHDHLVLQAGRHRLIFRDPRMFGRVRWHAGPDTPPWWSQLPPEVLEDAFTAARLRAALRRHARAPLKAVLLRQEHFPGIGNWMADEILWRAALHPALPAGRVSDEETGRLWKTIRTVARDALRVIGTDWGTPPDSWLFNHRWTDGGRCPKTGAPLQRAAIGGRTTCWSPARQTLPGAARVRKRPASAGKQGAG